jgi:hypothetical protein
MTPPVFICGHRKSGTTLLRNLLDGHTKLNVYPNDLGIFFLYFPNYILHCDDINILRSRLDKVLFINQEESCKKALLKKYHVYFDDWRKKFNSRVKLLDISELKNRSVLIDILTDTFEEFSVKIYGDKQASNANLYKETMLEINAIKMLEEMPGSKFIHVLRDPRANYASLKSGVETYYGPKGSDNNNTIMMSLVHRLQLSFGLANINLKTIGKDSYYLIRYEDLVNKPQSTLTNLSNWLGVKFENSLLKPTLFSSSQGSNNFEGDKKYEISSQSLNKWKTKITPKEELVISYFLGSHMSDYGYDTSELSVDMAKSVGEFYEWSNYEYFFKDFYS